MSKAIRSKIKTSKSKDIEKQTVHSRTILRVVRVGEVVRVTVRVAVVRVRVTEEVLTSPPPSPHHPHPHPTTLTLTLNFPLLFSYTVFDIFIFRHYNFSAFLYFDNLIFRHFIFGLTCIRHFYFRHFSVF